MERSFFEYLGMANLEKSHSQFFAWLISKNCHAINDEQKINILKKLFSVDESTTEIKKIITEWKNIDILIETNNCVIVIENKLKSSIHSEQLKKYKEICKDENNGLKKSYYLLSLIGESPDCEGWKIITYDKIYSVINELKLNIKNNNHFAIIEEYKKYLGKLTQTHHNFLKNHTKYSYVFEKNKELTTDHADEEVFIKENNLETIFQKSFMLNLLHKTKLTGQVSETRGNALIDLVSEYDILYNKKSYKTLIQLQSNTIKFVFANYKEYKTSNKKEIKDVYKIFEGLSEKEKMGYNKINKPKTKAYVSISSKLEEELWSYQIDELCKFIKAEIEIRDKITNTIIKKINE